MTGITDPAEEFFKDGLWGWVTDQWKKLIGDAAGHLQVDVVESGLPTGAATSANQATMITALQLIDDLRGALNSIHTDELDVVIDGQNADVEIKQTTAADLTPGVMGWDGSAWRKLPLLWGFSARWAEVDEHTMVSDAAYIFTTVVVPAGYVYKIEGASLHNNTGVRGTAFVAIRYGGSSYNLVSKATPAIQEPTTWLGELTLQQGDQIRLYQNSCLTDDVMRACVWGYKMKVAQ